MTGIKSDKIISVHGTFGNAMCEECQTLVSADKMTMIFKHHIKDIYNIDKIAPLVSDCSANNCLKCKYPTVKPSSVL